MSTEETPAPESRPSERWDRSHQAAHWREIGISAVAAAARYASTPTVSDAPAKGAARTDDGENKIVTLRDVEYFAA
ncbi:hypothetical protein FHS55_004119 [Angulomicrobium tetraedrale]|uniref:Uncharacterized protein n=1 Tax=Ancylobacter tetraedralis TaxID=217068 RepID=A0A839ZFZ0_9HYPH|nr:hypothetical protein [Ancylobacter tetraedralis]MBB3773482.1 hypothetical protein [Ancylobacter tetraedralis]